MPQRIGGAAEDFIAGRIGGRNLGAEFLALFVHDSFGANDHHVLLQLVNLHDALDKAVEIERRFGNQNKVRLAVGGAKGEIARMTAHDFDKGDAAMALGGGADALDAADAETKTAVAYPGVT